MNDTSICNQVIGFNEYGPGSGSTGKGFAKRTILIYRCPACQRVHHLRKNWSGPTPPGGFVCTPAVQGAVASSVTFDEAR